MDRPFFGLVCRGHSKNYEAVCRRSTTSRCSLLPTSSHVLSQPGGYQPQPLQCWERRPTRVHQTRSILYGFIAAIYTIVDNKDTCMTDIFWNCCCGVQKWLRIRFYCLRDIYRNHFAGLCRLGNICRNSGVSTESKRWQPALGGMPRITVLAPVRIIYCKNLQDRALFEIIR